MFLLSFKQKIALALLLLVKLNFLPTVFFALKNEPTKALALMGISLLFLAGSVMLALSKNDD